MNANNLSQVVGGILREGDRINIWSVTETNNNGVGKVTAEKICDYAYVTRVFTAAGVQVNADSGNDSAAMVINIIIPEEKEQEFNIALEKGTLRGLAYVFKRCFKELACAAERTGFDSIYMYCHRGNWRFCVRLE